jgi:hypothetical protein
MYRRAKNGIQGSYFSDKSFTRLVVDRRDEQIDFDWGGDAPSSTLPPDCFSVRWTGNLKIPADGSYTFYLLSDDGARLYVDDRLVVDNWGEHSALEIDGAIDLSAGAVPIRLEYYDDFGNARVRLSWSTPTRSKTVVAPEYFVR